MAIIKPRYRGLIKLSGEQAPRSARVRVMACFPAGFMAPCPTGAHISCIFIETLILLVSPSSHIHHRLLLTWPPIQKKLYRLVRPSYMCPVLNGTQVNAGPDWHWTGSILRDFLLFHYCLRSIQQLPYTAVSRSCFPRNACNIIWNGLFWYLSNSRNDELSVKH